MIFSDLFRILFEARCLGIKNKQAESSLTLWQLFGILKREIAMLEDSLADGTRFYGQ